MDDLLKETFYGYTPTSPMSTASTVASSANVISTTNTQKVNNSTWHACL